MKVCTTCGAEYPDEKLFCERDGTPLRKSGAVNDLVGMVIADRYHITKKLGEGGMGQVYLAEHVKMGRRCAIKIMTPGTMSDPEAISRFNREAANASRINHPNVCAIYDFGETPDGLIYLAMEFIEGKSLTDVLAEAGTLPLARAATMITQCAEALQVAHDLGIVHRDLKPDNIMVTTTRGQDTVKVVDFGIAKAIGGDDGKAQKVTKTGFVVGTPEYMSPEQLAGDPVDGRSDLYSLGLVFYRMLTGASPFPADSQQETMIKRLTDDPMPLAQARPEVRFPAGVQRVLDHILARNPGDRYSTGGEFARDVRTLVTGTAPVDLEAGTQVVRPEELKSAMPATRVDPAVARDKTRAPPSTQSVRAPVKKGFPVLPVAAVVALLAVGGGLFFMRQQAGGERPARSDSTRGQAPQPGTPTAAPVESTHAVPLSHPESTARPADTATVKQGGETSTKPPVSRPLRDSAAPPQAPRPVPSTTDLGTLAGELRGYEDDPDFVDVDAKRAAGKRLGERIYGLESAPAGMKARGAFVTCQAYLKENDMASARLWCQRAVQLDPSHAAWNQTLNAIPNQ